ncbi:acyltransferase [Nocardioides sp.]|uniref:acyltransferase n=1 Tax=Nocardioides sp. TaxID=35761 RepID=UPI003783444B
MGLTRPVNAAVLAGWRWLDRVGKIVPGTRAADGFGSFGADSCIGFPAVTLMGTRSIHLGSGVLVGRHATLAVGYGPDDPNLPERGLVVGDRCVLGGRITIVAHSSIEIGDDVWFGQDVFVSDSGHGYQNPHVPIGDQFGAHQPVRIGSGSWLGHGAIVLPGSDIGRNVVVAAGAVVRGSVPDHTVVGGAPARVIRRYEPGVGWIGTGGDVRPVVVATLEEILAEMVGEDSA